MKKRKYAKKKKVIRKTKSTSRKATKKPSRPRNTKGNVRRSKSIRKVARKSKSTRQSKKISRINRRLGKRLRRKFKTKRYEKKFSRKLVDGSYTNFEKYYREMDFYLTDDDIPGIVLTTEALFNEKFPRAKEMPQTQWFYSALVSFQRLNEENDIDESMPSEMSTIYASSPLPDQLGDLFYKKLEKIMQKYRSVTRIHEIGVAKEQRRTKKAKFPLAKKQKR